VVPRAISRELGSAMTYPLTYLTREHPSLLSSSLSVILPKFQYDQRCMRTEQTFDGLCSSPLKLFWKFEKGIKIGVYASCPDTYKQLTASWAENSLLSLVQRTPPDLVVPLKEQDGWGARSLAWRASQSRCRARRPQCVQWRHRSLVGQRRLSAGPGKIRKKKPGIKAGGNE
jgi:hypothetical protein